eukprot:4064905-Lingulodinium_polyedra.AAC.1
MLRSRQHLEGRIGEAVGMLDAARAAAEIAAEAATLAAQTEDVGGDCPVDPDDPDGAESSF